MNLKIAYRVPGTRVLSMAHVISHHDVKKGYITYCGIMIDEWSPWNDWTSKDFDIAPGDTTVTVKTYYKQQMEIPLCKRCLKHLNNTK